MTAPGPDGGPLAATSRPGWDLEGERLFALSVDLLCVADLDGHFLHLNPAWSETLGWAPEELCARPFMDFVHPDDRAITLAEMTKLSSGQETLRFENRYRTRDGEYRWLAWTCRPHLPSGRLYAVARDVTSTWEATSDLDRLIKLSTDLVCMFTTAGHFEQINPMFTEILGWTQDELLARPLFEFLHPDDVEPTRRELERLDRGERVIDFENRYRTRDGAYRRIQWRSSPDPGLARVLAVGRDVTEARRLEQDLRRAHDQAEEASQRAMAANHSKTVFLASMSHELRTPLNAILGHARRLAQSSGLDPAQRASAEVIVQSGEHLELLIGDLLDVSRIEVGQLVLSPRWFDLRELLASLHGMFELVASEQGLDFHHHVDPSLPARIHGDDTRLRQVAINLLSNAFKYTRHGHVRFDVSYDQGRLRFTVADTGVGIATDQLERIFRPFEQLGRSGAQAEGAGLGLAISLGIAQALGGALEVESTPDVGSTFRFEFPAEGSDAPSPAGASPGQASGAPGASGPGEAAPSRLTDERVRALLDAAAIGDLTSITRTLEELGASAPSATAPATRLEDELLGLARRFRLRRIRERLEQFLAPPDEPGGSS
ncbi:MAG: PAS domain S-box protein [Myxococcales bacterium]|nr:PAS domain S-box protein [Myxococcales bacterium]